jgi:tRNA(fMet)-specific endonuclease VapC
MNYIFDTSILIDALRRHKRARDVISKFEDSEDNLFISSVTAFELFAGQSSKDKTQKKLIANLLDYFNKVDISWKISKKAGEIFRDEVKGLGVPDYLIAATAIEVGAQVVTLNTKHFRQIRNLAIY